MHTAEGPQQWLSQSVLFRTTLQRHTGGTASPRSLTSRRGAHSWGASASVARVRILTGAADYLCAQGAGALQVCGGACRSRGLVETPSEDCVARATLPPP